MHDSGNKFRPRPSFTRILISVAITAIFAYAYLAISRTMISRSAADEIETGMSRKEVHRRIGKPHNSYSSSQEAVELNGVWGQSDMLYISYSDDSDKAIVDAVYN